MEEKIYKCNRCGEFYEPYPCTLDVKEFVSGNHIDLGYLKRFDLCMQCEAELKYFLTHSPKDSCENNG